MRVDLKQVEEAAKELYIRALKLLPPDVKQGLDALARTESDAGAKRMLGTMVANIKVAEDTDIRVAKASIARVLTPPAAEAAVADDAGAADAS